ncbi:MAG TPA: ribonuclease E/G, partial [Polyangia bacterium]|nr:ribonuclease E/G [Polyangia bacterium]
VTRAFNDHLRRDRSKAAVSRISELGLIEMTRKRTRESLLHALTEPCEYCEGKGYTKSRRTVAYELLRELRRQGNLIEGDTVLIEVHPDVAQVLATTDHGYLEDMEKRLQKRIIVKARGSFALEDFELRSPTQKTPLDRSDADREGDRADRRRRRRKKLGPPAEVAAMLEEEERSNAVDREVIGGESAPESRDDERAGERRGTDAEAAAGNSASDPSHTRPQPGTAEGPACAESPSAPNSPSSFCPSETSQVASETHAGPAGSNDSKPRG